MQAITITLILTIMLRFTSNANHSFFFLFFCLSLFLFSVSAPPPEPSVAPEEQLYEEVVPSTAEDAPGKIGTLVLAEERTRRKDWFNHFHRYTGGWNISDEYYIKSVISTAGPLLIVALLWFVIFGAVLLIVCSCYYCCNRRALSHYSELLHHGPQLLLIFCTFLAMTLCVSLYLEQSSLGESTSNTLDYVANQTQFVAEKLNIVSTYFDSAKQLVNGIPLALDIDLGQDIDDVKIKVLAAADSLSEQVKANSETIHKYIDKVILAITIVAVALMVFTFLQLVFCYFGWQGFVYTMVVIGWILVTGTLIVSAASLFVYNVTGDTCVAMDDWVMNPTPHTALDDILPCMEKATVLKTYSRSRHLTYSIVEAFDLVISNITNSNTISNYNQSGPLVPLLCNPFNSDLTPRHCASGEVRFQGAAQVWRNYICKVSPAEKCTSAGRLTPNIYAKLEDAATLAKALFEYGPFFAELVDCSFARKTFINISSTYCPPLRKHSDGVFVQTAVISAAVILCLLSSPVFVRQHRLYLDTPPVNIHYTT